MPWGWGYQSGDSVQVCVVQASAGPGPDPGESWAGWVKSWSLRWERVSAGSQTEFCPQSNSLLVTPGTSSSGWPPCPCLHVGLALPLSGSWGWNASPCKTRDTFPPGFHRATPSKALGFWGFQGGLHFSVLQIASWKGGCGGVGPERDWEPS